MAGRLGLVLGALVLCTPAQAVFYACSSTGTSAQTWNVYVADAVEFASQQAATYRNSASCVLTFVTNSPRCLSVSLDAFTTENGFDFLRIYDGTGGTLIAELSGARAGGARYNTTVASVLLRFTSDYSSVSAGFHGVVSAVACPPPPPVAYASPPPVPDSGSVSVTVALSGGDTGTFVSNPQLGYALRNALAGLVGDYNTVSRLGYPTYQFSSDRAAWRVATLQSLTTPAAAPPGPTNVATLVGGGVVVGEYDALNYPSQYATILPPATPYAGTRSLAVGLTAALSPGASPATAAATLAAVLGDATALQQDADVAAFMAQYRAAVNASPGLPATAAIALLGVRQPGAASDGGGGSGSGGGGDDAGANDRASNAGSIVGAVVGTLAILAIGITVCCVRSTMGKAGVPVVSSQPRAPSAGGAGASAWPPQQPAQWQPPLGFTGFGPAGGAEGHINPVGPAGVYPGAPAYAPKGPGYGWGAWPAGGVPAGPVFPAYGGSAAPGYGGDGLPPLPQPVFLPSPGYPPGGSGGSAGPGLLYGLQYAYPQAAARAPYGTPYGGGAAYPYPYAPAAAPAVATEGDPSNAPSAPEESQRQLRSTGERSSMEPTLAVDGNENGGRPSDQAPVIMTAMHLSGIRPSPLPLDH